MKTTQFIMALVALFVFTASASAAEQNTLIDLASKLDLDQSGMEKAKMAFANEDYALFQEELYNYYIARDMKHPDVNRDMKAAALGAGISATDRQRATDGLKHIFYCQKGYEAFYFGEDIDWQLWPVKDNEVRWQMHRMYWWMSMAAMYWETGDEQYAEEWVFQMKDWIAKNPYEPGKKKEKKGEAGSPGAPDPDNNFDWAWRMLEASRRLQDQTNFFNYFIDSPAFDSEFLVTFLNNYWQHANHVYNNYSKRGNHLLFESQRMLWGGAFFPEFADAEKWRASGVENLNREIKTQVYNDGVQFEQTWNYHNASINIFIKAMQMAKLNGFEDEFPESYKATVREMITATIQSSLPTLDNPMFGDSKRSLGSSFKKMFKTWYTIYPDEDILYFASGRKEGKAPEYLSTALKTGGVYNFRNSWEADATAMVVKAGPPAFWHSQPDNGTFELCVDGQIVMPDAGCYVYAGDDEIMKQRNWFRQTRVHNTLTLDNKNTLINNARLLKWEDGEDLDILSFENPSYEGLVHQRTIFFVDNSYFVIVDEARGTAQGTVGVHYLLQDANAKFEKKGAVIRTTYKDHQNIALYGFADSDFETTEEEGWVSNKYKKKDKATAFAFEMNKQSDVERFVTVILPYAGGKDMPKVSASFNEDNSSEQISVSVSVDGETKVLQTNVCKYKEIAPGLMRREEHLNNLMMTVLDLENGPAAEPDPYHSHVHEQICYLVSGKVKFILGDQVTILEAGDMITVPSGLKHCIQLMSEEARLVDCFTPIRPNFIE